SGNFHKGQGTKRGSIETMSAPHPFIHRSENHLPSSPHPPRLHLPKSLSSVPEQASFSTQVASLLPPPLGAPYASSWSARALLLLWSPVVHWLAPAADGLPSPSHH